MKKSSKSIWFYIHRDRYLYLLLLLPTIYYALFRYVPIYGVLISFKDYNIFAGISASEWVGLGVFKYVFKLKEFTNAFVNTFVLNIVDLIIGFPIPIILAILLNEIKISWYKRFCQSIMYIPYFFSWIVIGGIVYQMFATNTGMINILLKRLGLKPIPFLGDGTWWIALYAVIGIWQGAGWGTIVYLSAITGINGELYDAAKVDGANRLQSIIHVTIPGLRPTIVVMFILSVGRIASIGFDRPFVLGNSIVREYSDVISTFVYRIGIQSGKYNTAAAVGLFQSLINITLLLSANTLSKKLNDQGLF